jgi:glycosyltransferase involved in cell wall biosynthesis
MHQPPIVSIVLPTFNRARFIAGALETVLAQTYPHWELIIVIDGSTDETETVIAPYLAKEPQRIRCIRQPNAGLGAARNRALAEANGLYVAFLDDDDRWTPDKLDIQAAFLEAHPEIGLCYARAGAWANPSSFPELLQPFQSIMPSSVMMRTDLLRRVGGFRPLRHQEDYDLWLRFAQQWRLGLINRRLMHVAAGERVTLSSDLMRSHRQAIKVLRELRLAPSNRRYWWMKQRYIGYLSYLLAREHYVIREYWLAATWFLVALWYDPLIGLRFRQPRDTGLRLIARILKSYAAIPACVLRGVLHAAR